MDLSFTAEEQGFRDDVRRFLDDSLSPEMAARASRGAWPSKDDMQAWNRTLADKGWAAPHWPVDHGGCDWSATQRFIFDGECGRAGAPTLSPFGLSMVAPVIYTFGNQAQKDFHLPPIYRGDRFWCQGYSEPGSGSDLASLMTKAVPDVDDYIVNGHKIWTSHAHFADWIFCLVRTDSSGKPQAGISFLLIDMTTPGITVKPIVTMELGHHVNEVFFDDVRVPKTNRIGEENKGWTYAKFLLGHERNGIANVPVSKRRLRQLKEIAAAEVADGQPLLADTAFRQKLSETEIDLTALEYTNLRSLADEAAGKPPGPESSILKIRGADMTQRINELLVEAIGYYAAPYEAPLDGRNEPLPIPDYADGLNEAHLHLRAASIYGGSNEIQRNIIAKMVLGL